VLTLSLTLLNLSVHHLFIGAPIFVEPPIGLTIQKGKLAQLTCYVQGDPFPEVTWLFEDEIITPSETVSLRYVLSTLLPRPHQ